MMKKVTLSDVSAVITKISTINMGRFQYSIVYLFTDKINNIYDKPQEIWACNLREAEKEVAKDLRIYINDTNIAIEVEELKQSLIGKRVTP